MSPIDDELRAALHGRAQVLSPSPDPLAGVERRATRIQRTRVGAALAGSAMAVALVAAVVPAVQSVTSSQPQVPRYATSTQPTQPPTLAARPANAVRWPSTPLDPDQHDGFVAEWATTRERPGQRVEGEVLYAGRTPVGREVYVFQLWFPGEPANVAVMVADEAGPLPLGSYVATPDLDVIRAIVPGNAFPYVLVLPRPGVDEIRYAEDGVTFKQVALQGRAALPERTFGGGDQPDRIQLLEGGRVVYTGEAEPGGPTDGEEGTEEPEGRPDNLLGWPTRGGPVDAELEARLTEVFRQGVGRPMAQVAYQALFNGDTDGGVRYTIGQAWVLGEDAYTVALAQGGTQGEQFLLGPETDPDAHVVAAVVCCQPGGAVDTLVVIPVPGTGQVLYAPTRDGEPEPVGAGQDYLDGVVLVDRDPRADSDRLRLLDGDGDPEAPLFKGDVFDLLCGLKGCG